MISLEWNQIFFLMIILVGFFLLAPLITKLRVYPKKRDNGHLIYIQLCVQIKPPQLRVQVYRYNSTSVCACLVSAFGGRKRGKEKNVIFLTIIRKWHTFLIFPPPKKSVFLLLSLLSPPIPNLNLSIPGDISISRWFPESEKGKEGD